MGYCALWANTLSPPPTTPRLKLKHDELLSKFAFKTNLRRYTEEEEEAEEKEPEGEMDPEEVELEARMAGPCYQYIPESPKIAPKMTLENRRICGNKISETGS